MFSVSVKMHIYATQNPSTEHQEAVRHLQPYLWQVINFTQSAGCFWITLSSFGPAAVRYSRNDHLFALPTFSAQLQLECTRLTRDVIRVLHWLLQALNTGERQSTGMLILLMIKEPSKYDRTSLNTQHLCQQSEISEQINVVSRVEKEPPWSPSATLLSTPTEKDSSV